MRTSTEPTLCCDCRHVVDRKPAPYQWLCIKHRRLNVGEFVSPPWLVANRPYLLCKDTNGGACPLFEPIREASS